MSSPMRTRIAVRSAAFILGMILLVGLPLLGLLSARVRHREEARQRENLVQLLDTVERTAQVACFIRDIKLAEEVVAGLQKNAVVGRASLSSGPFVLADFSRAGWTQGDTPPVSRVIHSPFDASIEVGRLDILPNEGEITRQVDAQGRSIALLLGLQVVVVALATVTVVLILVTRPITRLSHRLHGLAAETGAKLEFPQGHEADEIGHLVTDVNTLIDRLVSLIHTERKLRDEVEVSLAEVKTLQGLLPICAWCRKVRDDEGLWTQIEQYVTERTDATFTHGLCPECAKEEFAKLRAGKQAVEKPPADG